MTGGRYRPEQLFTNKSWRRIESVTLTRIARAGDLLTHRFGYDDERTVRVDGEVFEFRVGDQWRKVKLAVEELRDVATEFFRLREDPALVEIVVTVQGGTFGERQVTIPEKFYPFVEDCLGPYRRAPLATAGAYR